MAGVFSTLPAYGQDKSLSEQLFIEGKALMQEKQYGKACEKLQASHDLDQTATGTLLNLALCHELTNRLATAWAEFRQAAAEAAGRRDDRVSFAREHEQKLFPLLSWVVLVVRPAVQVPGLTLRLDGGLPITEATWGSELPVDPGEHVLEASAPGKTSTRTRFSVRSSGTHQTVDVMPLAVAPPSAAPQASEPTRAELEHVAALRTRRIASIVVGGLGLASLSVGGVFGLVAGDRNSEAKALCPQNQCVDESTKREAIDTRASANTAANVANVAGVAGALLIVVGSALFLTALPPTTRAARWRGAPTLIGTGTGGGFLVEGAL
jgi:hypothetical protein